MEAALAAAFTLRQRGARAKRGLPFKAAGRLRAAPGCGARCSTQGVGFTHEQPRQRASPQRGRRRQGNRTPFCSSPKGGRSSKMCGDSRSRTFWDGGHAGVGLKGQRRIMDPLCDVARPDAALSLSKGCGRVQARPRTAWRCGRCITVNVRFSQSRNPGRPVSSGSREWPRLSRGHSLLERVRIGEPGAKGAPQLSCTGSGSEGWQQGT